MNKHAFCQELISRLLDEDRALSAEENAALQAHLAECEECSAMYRAFAALSDALSGELDDPPESLRENVMAEIRREQIRERNRRPLRIGGFAAAAAILVLVIGFAPRFFSAGRTAAPAATEQIAAGAMFAAYDNGAADSFEMPEAEYEAPRASAAESRKDAAGSEETAYISMDTEAAAAAENALPGEQEDETNYVVFGADISPDGELTEEERAWLDAYDEAAEEKISMSSLLFCLAGTETDEDLDALPLYLVYLIETDEGVMEIYRCQNNLYYYDPRNGAPCEAGCTENQLIRFLGD